MTLDPDTPLRQPPDGEGTNEHCAPGNGALNGPIELAATAIGWVRCDCAYGCESWTKPDGEEVFYERPTRPTTRSRDRGAPHPPRRPVRRRGGRRREERGVTGGDPNDIEPGDVTLTMPDSPERRAAIKRHELARARHFIERIAIPDLEAILADHGLGVVHLPSELAYHGEMTSVDREFAPETHALLDAIHRDAERRTTDG